MARKQTGHFAKVIPRDCGNFGINACQTQGFLSDIATIISKGGICAVRESRQHQACRHASLDPSEVFASQKKNRPVRGQGGSIESVWRNVTLFANLADNLGAEKTLGTFGQTGGTGLELNNEPNCKSNHCGSQDHPVYSNSPGLIVFEIFKSVQHV
ncbi:hypothetical protein [uncultured Roseobacter sp.]|uniref:hypothetical protein n=1 Tax=uncultured Roseobacter sp. TaxID=114847 RepID=UPI0034595E04